MAVATLSAVSLSSSWRRVSRCMLHARICSAGPAREQCSRWPREPSSSSSCSCPRSSSQRHERSGGASGGHGAPRGASGAREPTTDEAPPLTLSEVTFGLLSSDGHGTVSAFVAPLLSPLLAVLPAGVAKGCSPVQLCAAAVAWMAAACGLRRAGWRWPLLGGALVALGVQEVVETLIVLLDGAGGAAEAGGAAAAAAAFGGVEAHI